MVLLYFAGLGLAIEPSVNRRERDSELLGEFFLRNAVFEAVLFELSYKVGHGLHVIAPHWVTSTLFLV